MKDKIFKVTLVLAVLGLLIGASPVAAESTVVRFDPATANLSVGQTVAINVQIDNVTGLAGDEVNISYNPAVLDVQDADSTKAGVQVALGTFLKPDFVARNDVDSVQGRINFAAVQQSPTPPVSGSGVLATITFRAKANGTSSLTFTTVNLSTANGTAISRVLQNGQVNVGGGPAPTPTPTRTPGPTSTPGPTPTPSGDILGYHTVRYRETLYCIARAYGVSPWAIASNNGIGYPYWLRIGQRLSIPNVPWKNIYGPVCARQFGGTQPPPPNTCRATYVVRPGDTLYAIAFRYGTTVWALITANHIANPNWIFVGQSLCIP